MNPELISHIKTRSKELSQKVIQYREHIHQNPELSFQEQNTMEYVYDVLNKLNISCLKGIANTGVVAMIQTDENKNNPCIALRADLDALPIQEQTNKPYSSIKPGLMHACGHDVHTSILLGVAEILNEIKHLLQNPIKLIFQPGEEKTPGGASLMIEAGVLENPVVTEMYALHVFPELAAGRVGFRSGRYMASCDEIYITINGKGGHGAIPNECIDPIITGANIVTQLQQLISRNCDPKIPSVLSFGHFEALGATNVIPSKAIIKGTFRTMDEQWREKALVQIKSQAEKIASANGASLDIDISRGYPCLDNDIALTEKLYLKAKGALGSDNVIDLPIRLTSEDFSFYSQKIPVCFFRLGVRDESKGIVHGVHNSKFDISYDAIPVGIQMMCLAAI
ncbi:MAG: N-acyl-L-amino acid amidohydrolase [Crocinitomicaceae bacterium]|nr:N-acyl-L-amino acid amidohydrolase [Crocinitomicaceae bacterium]